MMFSLQGKVSAVTGALGLIGKEHCKALLEAGSDLVLLDIDADGLNRFREELMLTFKGRRILPVKVDISSEESVVNAFQISTKEFGFVDVLVNNAALNDKVEGSASKAVSGAFEDYPVERFRRALEVNVTGLFLCAQKFGAEMAKKGKGSIINVASTYGMVGPDQSIYRVPGETEQSFFKSPDYPTSKGAVIAFTKYLAGYLGPKGVRVNTLSPGGVEAGQASHFIDAYSKKTMLGRMAKPNDYKGALVFLASDESMYMTGANLVVDGGWTAW